MSKYKATATAIWTQFIGAIEQDFSINIPQKAGPETTKLIWDIVKQIYPEMIEPFNDKEATQ